MVSAAAAGSRTSSSTAAPTWPRRCPPTPPEYPQLRIDESYITALEAACDEYNAALPTLRSFILPGGTPGARCCTRRGR